jgi:DNA polymerase-3 subunit epsilon
VIDELYHHLAQLTGGADAEELLALVFGEPGGDPDFGRHFLDALLADDPRFRAEEGGRRWRVADKHLLDEPVSEAPFVVVDLETTGQRPDEAGITEIGAVRLHGTQEVERFESLVNPGKSIPPYVATLTGISDAMVQNAPRIEEVIPAFMRFAAGAVVVAHNAAFDVAVLDRASRRVLGRPLGMPALCTFKLARRLLPEVTRASLDGLASHFSIANAVRHRALADAELTAAVLVRLVRILSGEGSASVNTLLEAQESTGTARRLAIRIPRHSLEALPEAPGVFWLEDAQGQALFVGQADDLRARVIAYFAGRAHLSDRQYEMVSATADVGFRRADFALERALVEAQEICARLPLLNRPDKHLPRGSFVKIQRRGRFPRVLVAGRISSDAALYLGPLKSRNFADDAAALVAKSFALRTCPGSLHPTSSFEPCWLGPAGNCSSPCNASVNAAAYRAQVEQAERALAGDPTVLRAGAGRTRAGEDERLRAGEDTRTRDGAVVGRLLKVHRKRHWLVNAHHYVAAFPATGGGLWLVIVVHGLVRRIVVVGTREELYDALIADDRWNDGQRLGHLEADASTILAHWVRRTGEEEPLAVFDFDANDLSASLLATAEELLVLVPPHRADAGNGRKSR